MKLSHLLKTEPDDTIETNIGTLAVFPMTVASHNNLMKEFGEHLENADSEEFSRYLIGLVCHKELSLSKDRSRPKEKTITDENISKLSKSDLESFAKCFIKHNKQLTHERTSSKRVKDDNADQNSGSAAPQHQQLEKESYVDYLYRLEKLYAEEESKRRNEMKMHLSGITSSFSFDTQRKLASEAIMGAQLANQLAQQHSHINPIFAEPPPESSISQTLEDISRHRQERVERPFREMSERLDNMNNNLVDIGEYNLQFADTQKSILFELQESGQKNQIATEDNKRLTWLVIVITFVLGAIQIASAIFGNLSSSSGQQELLETNLSTNQFTEELVDLLSTSYAKQEELERKYYQLNEKLQANEMKNAKLEKTVQQLNSQLKKAPEN